MNSLLACGSSKSGYVLFLLGYFLPLGVGIAFLSALPFVVISAVKHRKTDRRQHRSANNLCIHCGYDLRATPNRCPECGRVPVAPRTRHMPPPRLRNRWPTDV